MLTTTVHEQAYRIGSCAGIDVCQKQIDGYGRPVFAAAGYLAHIMGRIGACFPRERWPLLPGRVLVAQRIQNVLDILPKCFFAVVSEQVGGLRAPVADPALAVEHHHGSTIFSGHFLQHAKTLTRELFCPVGIGDVLERCTDGLGQGRGCGSETSLQIEAFSAGCSAA